MSEPSYIEVKRARLLAERLQVQKTRKWLPFFTLLAVIFSFFGLLHSTLVWLFLLGCSVFFLFLGGYISGVHLLEINQHLLDLEKKDNA